MEVTLGNGSQDPDHTLGEERASFGDYRVRTSAARDELQRCHVWPFDAYG
jgi:hypothetical protein